MPEPLLQIEKLTMRFGGLTAVEDVSLAVQPAEIMAVIGPNGAGKTTLFNVISGIYAPTSGVLRLAGKPMARPWTLAHVCGLAVVVIGTGLAALMCGMDVDRLWAVTISQTKGDAHAPFDGAAAGRALAEYVAGAPHIESRMGRYRVVSADGGTTFLSTRDADLAQSTLAALRPQVLATRGPVLYRLVGLFALGALLGGAGAASLWQQSRRTASWIARAGVARTFQNNRLFGRMTALQNVEVALDRTMGAGHWRPWTPPGALAALLAVLVVGLRWQLWGDALAGLLLAAWMGGVGGYAWMLARWQAFSPGMLDAQGEVQAAARELLDLVGLAGKGTTLARHLAYGDQRRLEIARALATRPRLVLLDEPAAGMNPSETRALVELIYAIRERGIAVMLIEHDMKLIMNLCERIVVLEYGRKIADGTPEQIRVDPAVIKAYLGEADGTEP